MYVSGRTLRCRLAGVYWLDVAWLAMELEQLAEFTPGELPLGETEFEGLLSLGTRCCEGSAIGAGVLGTIGSAG